MVGITRKIDERASKQEKCSTIINLYMFVDFEQDLNWLLMFIASDLECDHKSISLMNVIIYRSTFKNREIGYGLFSIHISCTNIFF